VLPLLLSSTIYLVLPDLAGFNSAKCARLVAHAVAQQFFYFLVFIDHFQKWNK
jgi:hypothetical protein